MVTEADIRRLALALPATTEKPSYGTPGFRVKDKLFARIREEGDLAVWVAHEADKQELIAAQPQTYSTTPHYDGYPIVLVHMVDIVVDELTEILTDAWQVRAPRRLAAEHPVTTKVQRQRP